MLLESLMMKIKKIYLSLFYLLQIFLQFDFYLEILRGALESYWKVSSEKIKKIYPYHSDLRTFLTNALRSLWDA